MFSGYSGRELSTNPIYVSQHRWKNCISDWYTFPSPLQSKTRSHNLNHVQVPVSISDKTPHRQISWSLEAAVIQILHRFEICFETSRDLSIRSLSSDIEAVPGFWMIYVIGCWPTSDLTSLEHFCTSTLGRWRHNLFGFSNVYPSQGSFHALSSDWSEIWQTELAICLAIFAILA